MRTTRSARLAIVLAGAALALVPGAALAASETAGPPPAVVDWQAHLEHMRTMDPNLGTHLAQCVEVHGSNAAQFGPNGAMGAMMAGS